ncbi:MAG: cytidine deaminase [Stappia sp.]|uniref:cytidine deaminase n=1 Tax=Stappia sp. TaxID=1870903 RepID=UPI000C6473C9|nr:cytidine deaminase [Stappia sp.]MAB00271.1 cytidine deaminase [Stappia sp.]MBM21004.1 cytidine deaminase [Stappia sp.]|tara:strand:- start:896 stop:1285 length:390 start_codon:yes stop_codon:yes gene_type:complete
MSEIDALFQAAKNAREKAHAPYSDFAVGAAILTASGTIHAGCNVENASFPEGWCAETTALGHMVASEGKVRVEAVLVMADAALCTPCGGCRQRLAEFADDTTPVHVCDTKGVVQTFTLGELLPHKFVLK